MGLMDKIKNILFEEETVEIPIITKEDYPKEEVKEEKKPVKEKVEQNKKEEYTINRRFSNHYEETKHNTYDEEQTLKDSFKEVKEEVRVPKEEVKEEKKVEKSSPFLSFDEDEFELMSSNYYNSKKEEKRKTSPKRDAILYSKSTPVVEEPKKFKPSPIISPVYGILDKNYRKDDYLPTSSSEGTLPKIMDVDSVRKKAFGTLEEEIENKLKKKQELEATKELTNIDDDKTLGDLIDENLSKERIKNEEIPHYNTEEIKITSYLDDDEESSIEDVIDNSIDTEDEEVSLKEPEKEDKEEIKEVPKEEQVEEVNEPVEEPSEEVGDTTLESDLFDLIDSMYEKEEE